MRHVTVGEAGPVDPTVPAGRGRGPARRVSQLVAAVAALVVASCGGDVPEAQPEPPAVEASAPQDASLAEVVGVAPGGDATLRAIVLLDPHHEVDVPLPEEMPVMDQIGRQFVPKFILVRAGQTINFISSEDDIHTVHVKNSAGESLFNVAFINGSSYTHTFEVGDALTVICDTHTEMFADIMVVDSPYATVAARDGSFTLPGVVPGRYTVTVIFAADRREYEVEIVPGRNDLDFTEM